MAFEIRFKKSVQKDLRALPKPAQKRLLDTIETNVASKPSRGKALTGEFKGLYRWRTGSYRIIYEVKTDSSTIIVLRIGHRKDVYR